VRYDDEVRPIVRIALFAAAALSVERWAARVAEAQPTPSLPRNGDAANLGEHASVAPCPAEFLPDHGACVPSRFERVEGGQDPEVRSNAHRDRAGRVVRYDHIPRRPERPADYRRYRLPIHVPRDRPFVGSDYDLGEPDNEQRRGARFKAVGHGGVDWAAPRGAPVHAIRLEHQTGETEAVFVGELFGTSVVTRHRVLEAGAPQTYLIVHGHLERAASDVRRGDALPVGKVLGYVGDTGSPGAVHLHFELRRLREGTEFERLGPREWLHNSHSMASDPRNLLELEAQ